MRYQIAKGVFDILPKKPGQQVELNWQQIHLWRHVEETARTLASLFNFHEVRTPLFETTELFTRSLGEETDVVSKEMYTFEDRAGRSLSLRPEGTASVMRAVIENQMHNWAPVQKLFYLFPMFRYERSQAGRYRQHHQFGVEAIGSSLPHQDAEVIHLLWSFYQKLGLKNLTLHLHSIGNRETRGRYREALKSYLKPYERKLSKESQQRYETNPLRILDSKDPQDQEILLQAPRLLDFLDKEAEVHFATVCQLLTDNGVTHQINHRLVRGLDYYNRTVFEVTSEELGPYTSLGGGGRYDGLLHALGGPDLPACGFGAGLERIIQALLAQQIALPVPLVPKLFLIPLGEQALDAAFQMLMRLREQGVRVEMDFSGKKLAQAMRYADLLGAHYVVVIGDEELKSGSLELKEMATGNRQKLSLEEIYVTKELMD